MRFILLSTLSVFLAHGCDSSTKSPFFTQKMTGCANTMSNRRKIDNVRCVLVGSWLINWNLPRITTRKMYSQRLTRVNSAFRTAPQHKFRPTNIEHVLRWLHCIRLNRMMHSAVHVPFSSCTGPCTHSHPVKCCVLSMHWLTPFASALNDASLGSCESSFTYGMFENPNFAHFASSDWMCAHRPWRRANTMVLVFRRFATLFAPSIPQGTFWHDCKSYWNAWNGERTCGAIHRVTAATATHNDTTHHLIETKLIRCSLLAVRHGNMVKIALGRAARAEQPASAKHQLKIERIGNDWQLCMRFIFFRFAPGHIDRN